MALLIIRPGRDASSWVTELHNIDPSIDIRVWASVGEKCDIDFALAWSYPHGELSSYESLKCVASTGAGVDHILDDPHLPKGVRVTRVVERFFTQAMSQYVVMAVLTYYRHFEKYRIHQTQRWWAPEFYARPGEIRVGIMGLGQLGTDAARELRDLGFQVVGWSRSPKEIEGILSFSGDSQYESFLSGTNILICMLPLTQKTRHILNCNTFDKLEQGAYLINVGRGEHLVEGDLLAACERKQLSGACLDVFSTEPLPEDHPFWAHPQIIVTPHVASLSDPRSIAPQIVENYRRLKAGEDLLNEVDIERGY